MKKDQPPTTFEELCLHYQHLQQKYAFPLKVKVYFQIFGLSCQKSPNKLNKEVLKPYKRKVEVFSRQQPGQRTSFLWRCLQHSCECLDSKSYRNKAIQKGQLIETIETTCKIKQYFMGLASWNSKGFKFSSLENRISIFNKAKEQQVLDITSYFPRRSAKYPTVLILEAVKGDQIKEKLYIDFQKLPIFQEVYRNIQQYYMQLACLEISKLFKEGDSETVEHKTVNTHLKILSNKNINAYFRDKQKKMTQFIKNKIPFREYAKINNIQFYVSKSPRAYKLTQTVTLPLAEAISNISLFGTESNQRLQHFQKLQNFTDKISAAYLKYKIKDQEYEVLAINEALNLPNGATLFFKGIQNFIAKKTIIDFLYVNVVEVSNKPASCKITIVGWFDFPGNLNQDISAADFLVSLVKADQQKSEAKSLNGGGVENLDVLVEIRNQIIDTMEEEEEENDPEESLDDHYYTVHGSAFEIQERQQINEFGFGLNDPLSPSESVDQDSSKISSVFSQELEVIPKVQEYLKVYQPQQPTESKGKINLMKQHYLFTDWEKAKSGGVICHNEAIINEQKNVVKLILMKMGRNVLEKKSILNFSFPIQVFKAESVLISMARNLTYAPLLFDSVGKSPLERMKKVLLLMISFGSLTISLQKPFNPIVGETYQGEIDGCPIYLEQVSHHPPICTYLFVGRGYRVSGAVENKLELRLNSILGYNMHPNRVIFDDGQVIEFTQSKLLINAMLFGERTFNLLGTNYLFDVKNKLVTEVTIGAKKGFFESKATDPSDFLSGSVYKVSEGFMNNFLKKHKTLSPKKTEEVLSNFQGFWYDEVRIDGKPAINFRTQLPHQLHSVDYPLPSDSIYRTDLKLLAEEKKQEAQNEKQIIQDIQRKDKKLREMHKKNSH